MKTLRMSMAVIASAALAVSSMGAANALTVTNTNDSNVDAPITASLSDKTVENIAGFLESELQTVEDSTWGVKPSIAKLSARKAPRKSPKLAKRSEKQLAKLADKKLGVQEETVDLINVVGSKVEVKDSEVVERTADSVTVEYAIEFTRDIKELSAEEDWSETIPYEVTVGSDGQVKNILVKDEAYELAQASISDAASSDEPITYDPTERGSKDDKPSSIDPNASKPSEAAAAKLSSANKKKVAAYAMKWAKSSNPAYRTYPNDCTNFVSQALYAGGWKKIEGYYKSNAKWFGNGVMTSWTWSGAENFYKFARNESKRTSHIGNVYDLAVGDILQYKNKSASTMTHSMVTTKKVNGVPYLSYHTRNTLNKPFTQLKSLSVTWFAHRV